MKIGILGCATKHLNGCLAALVCRNIDTIGGLIRVCRAESLTTEDHLIQMIGEHLVSILVHVDAIGSKQRLVGVLLVCGYHQVEHIDTLNIVKTVAKCLGTADHRTQLCIGILAVCIGAGAGSCVDIVDLSIGMIGMDLLEESLQIFHHRFAVGTPYIDIITTQQDHKPIRRKRRDQLVIGMEPIPSSGAANAHIVAIDILGQTGLGLPCTPEVHVGITKNQGAALTCAVLPGNILIVQSIHPILILAFVGISDLSFHISLCGSRILEDMHRKILHRCGRCIVASELNCTLRHRNTVADVIHSIINQEEHPVAIYDHFKINAVSIAVHCGAIDQPPIIPAILVRLGHGEDLEITAAGLLQRDKILILRIRGNEDSRLSPITGIRQSQLALNAVEGGFEYISTDLHIVHQMLRIGIRDQRKAAVFSFLKEVRGQTHLSQDRHIFLCLADDAVCGFAGGELIAAGCHFCIERENTYCTLFGLKAFLVVQVQLAIDIEVVGASVTNQLQLYSITAGKGHAGNLAGYACSPVIFTAGRLADNSHMARGLLCSHIHEELDHLRSTVDHDAELGILVVIQDRLDINLGLKTEFIGIDTVQIGILRSLASKRYCRLVRAILLQIHTICCPVSTFADAEVLAKPACLAVCVATNLCRICKNLERKVLHCCGGSVITAEFDGTFRHRNTVSGVIDHIVHKEIQLIAIHDHLKIDAVAVSVQICRINELPVAPTGLIRLRLSEDLIAILAHLFQCNDILVLSVSRNQNSGLTPGIRASQGQLALQAVELLPHELARASHIIHHVLSFGIGDQRINAVSFIGEIILR